ncbi:hypothetical protein C2W62_22475 [Candidatus Entotheonella serta]|nr:hypothetical protein C2W62_22475 [Candidatus Entotheonella serta]
MFMTLADNHAGRNGSWEFFMDIRERGIDAFPDLQHREAASGTPTKSHNQLAGTKTYFVGGTLFGSQSFEAKDMRKTDAEISMVGSEAPAMAD